MPAGQMYMSCCINLIYMPILLAFSISLMLYIYVHNSLIGGCFLTNGLFQQ